MFKPHVRIDPWMLWRWFISFAAWPFMRSGVARVIFIARITSILYLSSQVIVMIHCWRPIIDVIFHSAGGICWQSQVLYPQLSNHKSRHSSTSSLCQPQAWRPWTRALYCASVSQEILWPDDVCRKPPLGSCGIVESTCLYCLPYYSQFIVLVAVLVVTCCYLSLISLFSCSSCTLLPALLLFAAALEDVGAVLTIKSAPAWQWNCMKLRGFASFGLRWDVAKIVLVELNLMLAGCVWSAVW